MYERVCPFEGGTRQQSSESHLRAQRKLGPLSFARPFQRNPCSAYQPLVFDQICYVSRWQIGTRRDMLFSKFRIFLPLWHMYGSNR